MTTGNIMDIINDMMELENIQGRHQGRWQYCEDKETVSDEYLTEITPLARAYGIHYEPDLKDNFDHETWEDLSKFGQGYAMDELGCRLYNALKKEMLNELEKETGWKP